MTVEAILEAVRTLPPNEQRGVAETILDELDGGEITEEEKQLIERRLAAYRANPDAGKPFEEVAARVRAKYGR